ncbi:uncharacterized protein LOC129588969 [Paramacrobiotus metropolitanus]|uniref:uncharacterized protein LOC129588969 n=1 Tax=Paramacrobiotus metropolitanus TaxID=2943436 RepID=UPI002445FEEF|nr:uncharacterized protein LOC129588969 [Paramacrobiotus metropolitanus]
MADSTGVVEKGGCNDITGMENSEGCCEGKRAKRCLSADRTVADPALAQQAAPSSASETEPRSTEMQMLLRGRFNKDFQPTQTTFPPGFRKVVRPSNQYLHGFTSVAATFRPSLASSFPFAEFSDVSNSRDVMLQKAGGAVCAAYEIAYGDQIAVFSAFMTAALEAQQLPYQPQTSRERAQRAMFEKRLDDAARLAQFVAMLPGFEDVSPVDRAMLVAEKSFVTTMLHHMKYIYKGDFYGTMPGPEQIHAGDYWMEILGVDPEVRRFCFKFSDVFNRVGLTLTESYMMLAAAFFDPRTTTASNKPLLAQLHTFYMDALTYTIGHRHRDWAERAAIFNKLNEASGMLSMAHQLSLVWFPYAGQTLPPVPAPLRTLLQDCLKP